MDFFFFQAFTEGGFWLEGGAWMLSLWMLMFFFVE